MKKFKVILSIFLVLLLIPPISAKALIDPSGDYAYIILEDNTISILKYHGREKNLTVPAEIDGKTVSRIGERAFSNLPIRTVTLPSTIEVIEDFAFYWCTSLTNVSLPEGLKSIGMWGFKDTDIKEIYIPDSVTQIGPNAFSDCPKLETVKLPKNLNKIEYYTFSSCYNLTNITLPTNLNSIEAAAFSDCYSLQEVTFSNSITEIGSRAFSDCGSLEKIILPKNLKEIENGVFQYCTNLTTITVPNSLEHIGFQAFLCSPISNVNIIGPLTTTEFANFKELLAYREVECDKVTFKFIANEDVNKNGSFDILDLSLISTYYNSTPSDIDFDYNLDFNNDLIIDIFDIVKIAKLL